jgi:TDG/mug DNA glycosylase family protein
LELNSFIPHNNQCSEAIFKQNAPILYLKRLLIVMQSLPDYLEPNLHLIFVGFNPGTRSAQLGHYYAGPGNLFWPLLYETGLIATPLTYRDDARVLEYGIGLTDLVKRSTPSSADLSTAEARAGVCVLERKLLQYAPKVVCFNGKGVYGWYRRQRQVALGIQDDTIGISRVFVAPSTSARNGRISRSDKAETFYALARFVSQCTGPA